VFWAEVAAVVVGGGGAVMAWAYDVVKMPFPTKWTSTLGIDPCRPAPCAGTPRP
jgi:hypothetical protein